MAENYLLYITASGTHLYFSTTAGGPWTEVNNLADVEPPEVDLGDVDGTAVSATNNQRRAIMGRQDPGTVKFQAYYDGIQRILLTGYRNTRTRLYWQLQTSDGFLHNWTAFIKTIKPLGSIKKEFGEVLVDEYTLRLTDDLPTFQGAAI